MTFPAFAVLTDPESPLLHRTPTEVLLPLWTDPADAESHLARCGVRRGGLLRVPGPRALAALLRSPAACEATAVAVDPPDAGGPAPSSVLTRPELFAGLARAA